MHGHVYLRYQDCLAGRLPIATGVIAAGTRHLIADRMASLGLVGRSGSARTPSTSRKMHPFQPPSCVPWPNT